MKPLFKDFKQELRALRECIEQQEPFVLDAILSSLDEANFSQRVLIYRLKEQNSKAPFTKQTLLRFLSLWEIDL